MSASPAGGDAADRLLEDVEIAYPQQPHCATVLLLDTSGSMAGAKITGLNAGLSLFLKETRGDELASRRIDLSVVTFGPEVKTAHDFSPVGAYPVDVALAAGGHTPMGEAVRLGMRMLEERKRLYREQGTDYYRPWLFLITDGEPTDMAPGDAVWSSVTGELRTAIEERRLAFFAVGVEGANMDRLRALCPPGRPPLRLRGLAFAELFTWLSRSQRQVSASQTGDAVPLPPVDWGSV